MPMTRGKKARQKRTSSRKTSNKRVFLDIPYHKRFSNYERAIVTTLLTFGLHPVIAKESKKTVYILNEVCELINSSKYAVVDISGLNFNVAFEAGYLHALGRHKFVLLKNKDTPVPSDLQGLKYSEYTSANTLTKALTGWLKQNVPEAELSHHAHSAAKIISKIKRESGVSQDMAKSMLLVMLEEMTDGDRKLPLT
jgi:predicted nucleotide-binding protein